MANRNSRMKRPSYLSTLSGDEESEDNGDCVADFQMSNISAVKGNEPDNDRVRWHH